MIFSTLGRLQIFTIKIQISRIDLVVVFIPMLDQTPQKGHFKMSHSRRQLKLRLLYKQSPFELTPWSNYPTYINRCCSKYRYVRYVLDNKI